ncbi:Eukaryotic translation initiation factor 3 subunit G [Nucella lapillus]
MQESTMSTGKSWAEQVDEGDDGILPPNTEEFDEKKGVKKITEYKYNEDGKIVKTVKTYQIKTLKVSKSTAQRKTWKKFGAAERDPPGPNPANTVISEEIFMQFVSSSELKQPEEDDDPLRKLKSKIVQCRICKGDHWTTKCPYKDTLAPLQEKLSEEPRNSAEEAPAGGGGGEGSGRPGPGPKTVGGKYVPPSLRDGGTKGQGESMMAQRKDEAATIRVTNLSEDTRESDLQELFRPFGPISRIYLAKDKTTGQSKGFAFINFHRRDDASRAIAGVSGFGYDHLILSVEWAKPSGQQ